MIVERYIKRCFHLSLLSFYRDFLNGFENHCINDINTLNNRKGSLSDIRKGNSTSVNFFRGPKNFSNIEVKNKLPKEMKDKIFKKSEFNRNNQILDQYSKTLTKSMKFLSVDDC